MKAKYSRRRDKALVAGKQKHEVAYEAKKSKRSRADVRTAVKKVGHSRKKVEAELRNGKRHGRG